MTRVLMAEATDYRGPTQVGSHALARQFVAWGAQVMWVGTPLYPHTLLRAPSDAATRRRIAVWRRGGTRQDRLVEYYPLTLLPVVRAPLLRSRFAARNTLRATLPPVGRVLSRHEFHHPDLLWLSASRFSFPMMQAVPARKRAYRMSDDWATFPEVPRALIELEKSVIDSVDAVFVTGRILEEQVRVRRPDVVYLPNGVDDAFFQPPAADDDLVRRYPAPRVVFAGTIGDWIDFDAVAQSARRLPKASILLVGPGRAARGADLPGNVHCTGPVPYERLPAIIHGCQAGIIPFRSTPRTEAASSNKLFQYLAAGLPVVASRTYEFERALSPAALADSPEAFAQAVADALARAGEDRPARVEFARAHTWSRRFDVVRATLGL
jgi:glycosyltransferase involved in cell wall biosynthesis